MEEEKKVYPQIEELLPRGNHIVKVFPQNLWDDNLKEYTKGTLMSGTYKSGNGHWYIFKTKIGEEYVSMFASDETKQYFEQGFIKVSIKPKRLKGSKEDIYDATGKKVLRAFYNGLSPVELSLKLNEGVSLEQANAMVDDKEATTPETFQATETIPTPPIQPETEEIDIENLPFKQGS